MGEQLETGKVRGLVGNHVVPLACERENVRSLGGKFTVRSSEGVDHADFGPGGLAAVEGPHSAKSELAETTFQEQA